MATGWPRAIVFDLDGTLVDSAPDIQRALNAGFAPLGVAPFDLPTAMSMIGGGAQVAIRKAAGNAGIALTASDEKALLERFYAVYAEASAEGRGLYPGANELLGGLRGRGHHLALCTNKAEHVTAIAVRALGIVDYFHTIIGARDDLAKKPAPAMLLAALAPAGVSPRDAVMIGDSVADVGAAKAAGCRSIAVSYGYAKMPPAELGADILVDALQDVPAALTQLGRRQVSKCDGTGLQGKGSNAR